MAAVGLNIYIVLKHTQLPHLSEQAPVGARLTKCKRSAHRKRASSLKIRPAVLFGIAVPSLTFGA